MTNTNLYLVCGSRAWPAPWFVSATIMELVPIGATILTGGARGVDRHAADQAGKLGYKSMVMDADWEKYGKRAGIIRNLAMLDQRPVMVIAFHSDNSRGTAHTIAAATERGIPVHVYTEDDLGPGIVSPEMSRGGRTLGS